MTGNRCAGRRTPLLAPASLDRGPREIFYQALPAYQAEIRLSARELASGLRAGRGNAPAAVRGTKVFALRSEEFQEVETCTGCAMTAGMRRATYGKYACARPVVCEPRNGKSVIVNVSPSRRGRPCAAPVAVSSDPRLGTRAPVAAVARSSQTAHLPLGTPDVSSVGALPLADTLQTPAPSVE